MATTGRDGDRPRQELRRRRNAEMEETHERVTDQARPFDPERELPGVVFMVPNRHWGFEAISSEDHPGACAHYQDTKKDAILVKGTDEDNVGRHRHRYFFVAPTDGNGLEKTTAFELVPRYFRLHRVRLFYPERYLGRLDEAVLHGLCEELARLHAED